MPGRTLEARMFAALSATNEAILRAENAADLFQRVSEAAVYGGDVQTAGILLPEADGALRIVASATRTGFVHEVTVSVEAGSERGNGLAGPAFRTGRAHVSNDVQADPRLAPWREENRCNGVNAVAAVPLLRHGRSVGVFLFCLARAGSLTDDIVALLVRMVENVAFALDGFEREERRRAAELASERSSNIFKALSATNEAILRAASAPEMLQAVAKATVDGGKLLGCAIFQRDGEATELTQVGCAGPAEDFIARMRVSIDPAVPHGQGLGGRAFRANAPFISDDAPGDPRIGPWRELAAGAGLQAFAVLPIARTDRPTGLIYFFYDRNYGPIDAALIELMSRIASNIAFGLDRFAEEEARRRSEREQADLNRMYVALSATNEAIMRASSREELFDLVCTAAVLGGQFTSTTVALSNPAHEFLDIVASRGTNAERVLSTRFSTSANHPQGRGLTGTAFRTRAPCIINDFLGHPGTRHWHRLAEGGGTRSGAAFPLLKGDAAVGVILFLAREQDVFSPRMVELLARLAENLSFALANFDRAEEKVRADRQISFLATHDALTGLPNRAKFTALLDVTLAAASAAGEPLAVLFVDLDRFKVVNDSLGHAAGDRLLKLVGRRLRSCVPANDVVARLGGDEFIVLLRSTADEEEITRLGRRILRSLGRPLSLSGHECHVTASIGVARFPQDGCRGDDLIKNADRAMYLVKEEGKNGLRFFAPQSTAPSLARLSLEADLRRAVDLGQLRLAFQPKCNALTGRLSGLEALLRWNHPVLGEQSPQTFIPLAEESGLIIPIGRWVLRAACAQSMAWQRDGRPAVPVAVNLSPRQFLDPDLLRDIDGVLAETGLPPALLQLEITESMMMHNVERAIALLNAIRGRGVRLAIDDFGTGYSSMSLMKRFPIDTIKIDRSFVRDVASSPADRAIATAIIGMGRALGLTVVAEGVETAEQAQFLRAQHCDELQGFLFSRPLPPEDVAGLFGSAAPSRLAEVAAPSIVAGLPERAVHRA
jgi:diguanylate cyclase (GGDEF)-like protein